MDIRLGFIRSLDGLFARVSAILPTAASPAFKDRNALLLLSPIELDGLRGSGCAHLNRVFDPTDGPHGVYRVPKLTGTGVYGMRSVKIIRWLGNGRVVNSGRSLWRAGWV